MVVKLNSKQTNKLQNIQINLRYSMSGSLHLCKLLIDLDIDIAIIQEPYANINSFNNKIQIPSVPDFYSIHHSPNNKHALYGAIILSKR